MAVTVEIGGVSCCPCCREVDEVLVIDANENLGSSRGVGHHCTGSFCIRSWFGGSIWPSYVTHGSGNPCDLTLNDLYNHRDFCAVHPANLFIADEQLPFGTCHHNFDPISESGFGISLDNYLNNVFTLDKYRAVCLNTLFHGRTASGGYDFWGRDFFYPHRILTWLQKGNRRLIVNGWFFYIALSHLDTGPVIAHNVNRYLSELNTNLRVALGPGAIDQDTNFHMPGGRFNYYADFSPNHYLTAGLPSNRYGVFHSNAVTGGTPLVTAELSTLAPGVRSTIVAVERFQGSGGPYEIVVSGNGQDNPFVLPESAAGEFWKRVFPRNTGNGGRAVQ